MMTDVCREYMDLMRRFGDVITELSSYAMHRDHLLRQATDEVRSICTPAELREMRDCHIVRISRDGYVRLTSLGTLMAGAIKVLEERADDMAAEEDALELQAGSP